MGVFFTFCFISSEGEIRLVGLVVGVNACFSGLDLVTFGDLCGGRVIFFFFFSCEYIATDILQ